MMRKRRITAAALALSLLALTGCGGYEEFDLLSEYLSSHPDAIVTDTAKVFGCDADVLSGKAGAKEVTNLYLEAFAEGKEKGYVPVLVFLEDILERKINFDFEEKGREAYIIEALSAERPDGKELFDKYRSFLEQYYGEELSVDDTELDMLLSLYGSLWSERLLPSADRYDGDLYLVKVPAENPYEIFAWLPFGGWNECPDTNEMIAMCEYWYKEYGAVPAAITYDSLTFYLSDPVSDRETAIKAAKEQCAFSSEALGMGGIEDYVLMTLNSNVWSFWWD